MNLALLKVFHCTIAHAKLLQLHSTVTQVRNRDDGSTNNSVGVIYDFSHIIYVLMAMYDDFAHNLQPTLQGSPKGHHNFHGIGYHTICPRQSGLLCGAGGRKSSPVRSGSYGKKQTFQIN